jgi:hypothetical protein
MPQISAQEFERRPVSQAGRLPVTFAHRPLELEPNLRHSVSACRENWVKRTERAVSGTIRTGPALTNWGITFVGSCERFVVQRGGSLLSRFGSVPPQDAYLLPSASFFSVSCMPWRISARRSAVSDQEDKGAMCESSSANAFSAYWRAKAFCPSCK